MKIFSRLNLFIFFMICMIHFSCRESLISSGDEEKEQLIQGSWIYYGEAGTIFLTFKPDLTVDIINSLDTNVFTFNYRIEDGDLYFLLVDNNQQVEFVYTIESLTSSELVLSFINNSGFFITQTYLRP